MPSSSASSGGGASPEVANPRLGADEIDALRARGRVRRVDDGEALFEAGDERGGFYLVLEGEVEVLDRSGREPRTIARHGPGQFTGDIDIVTLRRPVVSAVARGATEVVGVPSADVRRLIGAWPRLGETILRAFIARREDLIEGGYEGVRVLGSVTSRDTFRIREFLTRNQVPFAWIDVDDEPGVGALSALFSFIGAVPRTDWLPPEIETDAKGFIRTGREGMASPHWPAAREPYLLETSRPGIFAAGDVRAEATPRIASAVGEGAMAVRFVHAHLAEAVRDTPRRDTPRPPAD